MSALKRVAVIVPAYNVEKHICGVVSTIPLLVEKIIVVDDGSTDRTVDEVLSLHDPRLILLRHERNRGVGAAMVTGYTKAVDLDMEVLVKMDGDGQMRPEHLPGLVRPLVAGEAHYAKGNRFTDYKSLEKMPSLRRLGNVLLSFSTKLVSGYWNIFDVTNGYTAMLAETFQKLDLKDIGRGYFFEISMLVELNIAGARVVDIDMPSHYAGEKSNLRLSRVAGSFPLLMAKCLIRRFYRRYMVRDFSVLSICVLTGLPLFLMGLFRGLWIWMLLLRIM